MLCYRASYGLHCLPGAESADAVRTVFPRDLTLVVCHDAYFVSASQYVDVQ